MQFAFFRTRLVRFLLLAGLAEVAACGGGRAAKPSVPGTLLDQQTVKITKDAPSSVHLGTGTQTALITFPAGATPDTQSVQVVLSSNVSKSGATPANGTVIQIITINLNFAMPAVLQEALPPPPSGKEYRAATAAPGDAAWTIGDLARPVGAAPAGEAGAGDELYEIDVRGTGIWTIVLVDVTSGGIAGTGGAGGLGAAAGTSGSAGEIDAAAGTGGGPGDATAGTGDSAGTGGSAGEIDAGAGTGGGMGGKDAAAGTGGSAGTSGSAGEIDAGAGTGGGTGGNDAAAGTGGSAGGSAGAGGSGMTADAGICPGVDTESDPLNCGACGNACALTTIADNQASPAGIALGGSSVYWTISNSTGGAVMIQPQGGGPPLRLALQGLGQNPHSIAVDATSIYTTNGGSRVMKMPLGGGASTMLAASQQPTAIAVDATNVYWTEAGSPSGGLGNVMKLPLGGGTPTALATGQDSPGAIAIDATSVYWTNRVNGTGRVMKVSIDGGAPTTLAGGLSLPSAIAVDATSVYWTTAGGTFGVMKVPLAGGTPTMLAIGQAYPNAIVVDATYVYWTNGSVVMRVPLGGGTPTRLTFGGGPGALAVDATSVYWIGSVSSVGKIMRFDKQACQAGVCKCPGPDMICNGTCLDTSTFSSNCGTCGNVCSTGKTCQGGSCKCPGTTVDCFGVCVDTSTDSTNCGTCGANCAAGKTCQGGGCS
jgi:hypothetical protein